MLIWKGTARSLHGERVFMCCAEVQDAWEGAGFRVCREWEIASCGIYVVCIGQQYKVSIDVIS